MQPRQFKFITTQHCASALPSLHQILYSQALHCSIHYCIIQIALPPPPIRHCIITIAIIIIFNLTVKSTNCQQICHPPTAYQRICIAIGHFWHYYLSLRIAAVNKQSLTTTTFAIFNQSFIIYYFHRPAIIITIIIAIAPQVNSIDKSSQFNLSWRQVSDWRSALHSAISILMPTLQRHCSSNTIFIAQAIFSLFKLHRLALIGSVRRWVQSGFNNWQVGLASVRCNFSSAAAVFNLLQQQLLCDQSDQRQLPPPPARSHANLAATSKSSSNSNAHGTANRIATSYNCRRIAAKLSSNPFGTLFNLIFISPLSHQSICPASPAFSAFQAFSSFTFAFRRVLAILTFGPALSPASAPAYYQSVSTSHHHC